MPDPRFTANPAWAIQYPNGYIPITFHRTRASAIEDAVRNHRLSHMKTWREMYRRGYRAVKVWLSTEDDDG